MPLCLSLHLSFYLCSLTLPSGALQKSHGYGPMTSTNTAQFRKELCFQKDDHLRSHSVPVNWHFIAQEILLIAQNETSRKLRYHRDPSPR